MGEFSDEKSQIKENSAFLRKLLNQSKPTKVSYEEILAVKEKIEAKKFRIQLLQEQHSHKSAELEKRTAYRNNLLDTNQEEGNVWYNIARSALIFSTDFVRITQEVN